jgi:hypothetical protein
MFGVEQAMVQVIENRADIEGRVLAVAAEQGRPNHRVATIEIDTVKPVENYSNLFATAAGTRVDVIVPVDNAGTLEIGSSVRCRIRRAGPTSVLADYCIGR